MRKHRITALIIALCVIGCLVLGGCGSSAGSGKNAGYQSSSSASSALARPGPSSAKQELHIAGHR